MTEVERLQLERHDQAMSQIEQLAQEAMAESTRPSVLFRPKLMQDGDCWIMLYGEDLQQGVAGSGKSPENAARAFDKAWQERNLQCRDAERMVGG